MNQGMIKRLLTASISSLARKYLPGVGVIRSGDEININGVGPAFEGTYYVQEVTHTFSSDSGYRRSFRLKRSATGEGE